MRASDIKLPFLLFNADPGYSVSCPFLQPSIFAGGRSSTQLQKLPPANPRHLSFFFTSLSVRVASFSSSPSFPLANLMPRDRLSAIQPSPLISCAYNLPSHFPSRLLTPFASKALAVLVL